VKNKTTYSPTYWNGDGELQEIHDALCDALVPDCGNAPTEHGEALRCIARIYYEAYNNGGCNARDRRSRDGELTDRYAGYIDHIDDFASLDANEVEALRNALKYGNALCHGRKPRTARRLDALVTKVTRLAVLAHLKTVKRPKDGKTA
jgi:hypothetical protein